MAKRRRISGIDRINAEREARAVKVTVRLPRRPLTPEEREAILFVIRHVKPPKPFVVGKEMGKVKGKVKR